MTFLTDLTGWLIIAAFVVLALHIEEWTGFSGVLQ